MSIHRLIAVAALVAVLPHGLAAQSAHPPPAFAKRLVVNPGALQAAASAAPPAVAVAPARLTPTALSTFSAADRQAAAQLTQRIQSDVVAVEARIGAATPGAACSAASQAALLQVISKPTPGVAPAVHLAAVQGLASQGGLGACATRALTEAVRLDALAVGPQTTATVRAAVGASPSSAPPTPESSQPPNPPSAALSGCRAGDGLPGLPACYNAPATIPLYRETRFTLIIASNHIPSAAEFNGAPGPVLQRNEPINVGSLVKAELWGPSGQVAIDSSQTDLCQEVTSASNAEWDWYVSPKTSQPVQLQVTLYQVSGCGTVGVQSRKVDHFVIPVTGSIFSWVRYYASSANAPVLAVLAVITAAGGAFGAWAWIGQRRKRRGRG